LLDFLEKLPYHISQGVILGPQQINQMQQVLVLEFYGPEKFLGHRFDGSEKGEDVRW
jgi:hypothetical protein